MKTAKLRYPCKVAGYLYPVSTVVELLGASDIRVKTLWPEMQTNLESSQVAVLFPDRVIPTICAVSQIEYFNEIDVVHHESP